MVYLTRLWNLIQLIGKAIFKFFGYVALSVLTTVYAVSSMAILLPIAVILQLLWFIIVHPIYYIVSGDKYGKTYNGPTEMWADFMFENRVTLKIDNAPHDYHKGFLEKFKDYLSDIKVEL